MLRRQILRPQRFEVNDNYVVRVTLRRGSDVEPNVLEARLIDLSCGGAKLSIAEPLRFQELVELSLHCEELGLHLVGNSNVAWVRLAKDQSYLAGCAFNPPLVPQSLDQLFANGLLERRRARRYSVRGQALASWELCPAETPVGLLNLSAGGVAVLSPTAANLGANLRLKVERHDGEPLEVVAVIRWQMQVDGGYIIGCTFPLVQSYTALRRFLLPELDLPPVASPKRALAMISLAGLAMGAVWCWRWLGGG